MGSVKICEDGIEYNYESKYKCPACGRHDRTFKLSIDMTLYGSNDENVRFETCSCGETLKIETVITIVGN